MTNPQVIAELRRIAAQHGGQLKPSAVVQVAADEESPLHPHFDWSDTEAAHKWRLHQARQLIRVSVEMIGPKDSATMTRVFVSLTPDRTEDAGYRVLTDVMSDPDYRKQLLIDALEEMQRFEKKYHDLKELAGVFSAMRKVRGRDRAA